MSVQMLSLQQHCLLTLEISISIHCFAHIILELSNIIYTAWISISTTLFAYTILETYLVDVCQGRGYPNQLHFLLTIFLGYQ